MSTPDLASRKRFLIRIAAAASTLALTTAPRMAHAQAGIQPTAAQDDDTIVVTGFRQSLTAALGARRADNGIVDVIVAEDIADFPDQNLAESLQRISGVSIDRDAGEGRSITVRGLGGDFTRVRLNQLEALTTTGGTDSSGGNNRSRTFDFNVFASELFNRLTVRKSSSAEVDEGSLGATVDLQTARPFDYSGFVVSASAQAGYNDLSRTWDPRGAFLISNTFADGRFGILASVSYSERSLFEEGFSSVRWDAGNSVGGFCSPVGFVPLNPATTATNCGANSNIPGFNAPARPANTATNNTEYAEASVAGNVHPRLPRYGRLTHDQQRLGITLAVQAEPWEGARMTADVLYANLRATRQEDFLEAISFSRTAAQGGKPQTSVVNVEYDANGNLLFGTFNGVDIRSEQRFDELETNFWQYQFQWDQQVADNLRFSWLAGHSTSRFRNPFQTTTTLDIANVNGYSIDFRNSRGQPTITYPFDVTSTTGGFSIIGTPPGVTPSNITASEIRIRPQGTDNDFTTFRGDLAWDIVRDRLTLKAGGFFRDYDFETFEFRRVNQNDTILALQPGTPLSSITTVLTGFGRGLNLGGSPTSWLVPNLTAIANLYNIYCNCLQSGNAGGPGDFTLSSITNGNARGNNRAVTEESYGGYVQLDFRTDLFGRPLRGNIGLRYVQTSIEAAGYQALGGGTLTIVNRSYDDWLPSFNLAYDVTNNFVVRLAGARVMSRPQLGNLSPGGTINTTGQLTITSGNPQLDPFRAWTLDASLEWYFAPESVLSVGLFYKDIGTFIQTLRTELPFNATGLPLALLPANFTGNELFLVTAPINTSGGPLKGFEINFQAPFRFLPGPLRNLGAILNFTYVESEIAYVTSATSGLLITDDLVNLSPRSWNATLYYDDGRFSVRGSVSYRSDYLQRVPAQNVINDVEGKNSTLNVDASASFRINDHLTLTAEAINLTDEFNDQFVDRNRNSPSVVHHTGRQFYIGARVRF
ncbi:TonB-dependent receptor [Sphingosinicella sp.]|uniref:TonB-dependent receptor n=1 Tax=Sphingosinicella sp. TaxID=1917971 RepID=UPI0040376E5C